MLWHIWAQSFYLFRLLSDSSHSVRADGGSGGGGSSSPRYENWDAPPSRYTVINIFMQVLYTYVNLLEEQAALFVTFMMRNEPEQQGPVEKQQIEQLITRQKTLKLVFKSLKSFELWSRHVTARRETSCFSMFTLKKDKKIRKGKLLH